jgi:hypothetical protein
MKQKMTKREQKMKKAILLIILIGITFLGCSDNLDNTLLSISDVENLTDPRLERDPHTDRNTANTDLKKLSVSKLINGETGGELIIDTTYINYQGRLINVFGRIFFVDSSFTGTTEFTMVLHPEDTSVELFPHNMVFDRVARVSVWYTGVDLDAMGYNTTGHVDFAFFADDGSTEIIPAPAQQSHVNMEQNTIKVLNAQLHHFSRYGWIR